MAKKRDWIAALRGSTLAGVFPWQFVTSRQLAKALGVHLQTLANWRVREVGPTPAPAEWFVGRPLRYQLGHVWVWAFEQAGVIKAPWEINADWLQEYSALEKRPERQDAQEQAFRMMKLSREFRPSDLTREGRRGLGI